MLLAASTAPWNCDVDQLLASAAGLELLSDARYDLLVLPRLGRYLELLASRLLACLSFAWVSSLKTAEAVWRILLRGCESVLDLDVSVVLRGQYLVGLWSGHSLLLDLWGSNGFVLCRSGFLEGVRV